MPPDELTVVTALPQRPRPPAALPAAAKRVWRAIVADYRPEHFRAAAHLLLLEQFCRARALAEACDRRIAKRGLLVGGKVNPLIAVRAHAWGEIRACATKLRLAISSTMRSEKAAARTNPNAGLKKPWV